MRWQILPGVYEKNGYVTNLDLTLPNAAAGNLPGALRFADQEGVKTFIDTYRKQVQPRLGVAYAVSPDDGAQRAATARATGPARPTATASSAALELHRLQRQHLVNRATRPTPNAQDPVMYLSERYPDSPCRFPNRDVTQRTTRAMTITLGR